MNDIATAWMAEGGYVAIGFLMFLENVFPPIPSEVIMPLAGMAAAKGDLSLWGVIVAGSVGSLAGAYLWYLVGRWIGTEGLRRWSRRHGRWLTLTPKDVDKADRWFERYGPFAVLFGRLIPTVRTLISVPAGMSEMPKRRFLLFSGIGTVAWTALLATLGSWLATKPGSIQAWIDPVSFTVLGIALVIYVWRFVTFRPDDAPARQR